MPKINKLTTSVFKDIRKGSPYVSWKTTFPKQLAQAKGMTDNFKVEWQQYGDGYLLHIVPGEKIE